MRFPQDTILSCQFFRYLLIEDAETEEEAAIRANRLCYHLSARRSDGWKCMPLGRDAFVFIRSSNYNGYKNIENE